MSNPNDAMRGTCLCGGIVYEVNALEPKMGHCHCSMCRKFHGAAFATYGEAKRENFRAAFHGFDFDRIARYQRQDVDRLFDNTQEIRLP